MPARKGSKKSQEQRAKIAEGRKASADRFICTLGKWTLSTDTTQWILAKTKGSTPKYFTSFVRMAEFLDRDGLPARGKRTLETLMGEWRHNVDRVVEALQAVLGVAEAPEKEVDDVLL